MSVRTLTTDLQEKAINELSEVPDRKEDDIRQIQEWLNKLPHLNARRDDQWILNFLRGSKFSIQKTKERLDYYYTIRTLAPEIFANRDPLLPEMQEMLKVGAVLPLPVPIEPSGPIVLLVRWGDIDPEKHLYAHLCKMFFMIMDILLNENDNFVVSGVLVVEDLDEFHNNYLLQMFTTLGKKFMSTLQNAYPIRIKGLYCFNVSSVMDAIYNFAKPLMTEKLNSRIKFYGKTNFDDLRKLVPPSVLPKQYGGEGGCLEEMTAEWKKKVESYRGWFQEDAKYFSNETKRPGKPKTSADVFGVEGSFRKLNVD